MVKPSDKNPLRLIAAAAVFSLFFDCLVWAVLRRVEVLTFVRIAGSIIFLWFYGRRSNFAWHAACAGNVVIALLYFFLIHFHLDTPPHGVGIYTWPGSVLIILLYLFVIRERYFRFIDLHRTLSPY